LVLYRHILHWWLCKARVKGLDVRVVETAEKLALYLCLDGDSSGDNGGGGGVMLVMAIVIVVVVEAEKPLCL
jgi:hypothetical protein